MQQRPWTYFLLFQIINQTRKLKRWQIPRNFAYCDFVNGYDFYMRGQNTPELEKFFIEFKPA